MVAGADVNARDDISGESALSWVARKGHLGLLQVLLAAGADPRVGSRPLVEVPAEKEKALKDKVDGAYSQALVLSRQGHEFVSGRPGMGELLLSFQGALASETLRGVWVRAVLLSLRGMSLIDASGSAISSSNSRVEVVHE